MKRKERIFIIFSLTFLSFTSVLPIDGYTPALLYIKNDFQIPDHHLQLTLSLFMLTMGLGQLLFGPLSDLYGRRKIAFISIFLFECGSFLYMYAANYPELLLSRFIQGAGAAGLNVLGITVVRDLYKNADKIARAIGYISAGVAFSPTLAPLLQGYLASSFGWQATGPLFWISGILAAFIAYGWLPETLPPEKRGKPDLSVYKTIILDPYFLFYSLISAISLTFAFIFSSVSALVFIRLLGQSTQIYAFYYTGYGFICLASNFFAGYLASKIHIDRVIHYGFLIAIVNSVGMLAWNYAEGLSISSFYIPMMGIIFGSVFTHVASISGAIEKFGKNAGTAVALNTAFRFAFISLIGMFVVQQDIHAIFPVNLFLLLLSLAGTCVFLWKNKKLGSNKRYN